MILKAMGGKAQQVTELALMCPPDINTYYEPFAGGLALYWEFAKQGLFDRAVINDKNPLVADVYRAVQENAEKLVYVLQPMRDFTGKTAFETMRSQLNAFHAPQSQVEGRPDLSLYERAAYVVYMNKRGFNGLFRVNQSGQLNMPWGADGHLTSEKNLLEAGRLLQATKICCGDFEQALAGARSGDFVFADPPYLGTFSDYAGAFSLRDHRRLERVLAALNADGVRWMVCNSESPEVRQIWRRWNLRQVYCRRNGNSDGTNRGYVPELRITNY